LKGAQRRFSYANVMSTLAVFLALGGSALAVTQINGKRLEDRSVAGKKLKSQTIGGGKIQQAAITGKQVKEGTLGKVPSGKSANAATAATSANTATTATTAITANNSLALGGLPASAYVTKTSTAKVASKAADHGRAVWVRCRVEGRGWKATAFCPGSRQAVKRVSR
jgi:hypothetical protein